jgi:iron-sulfur cluster assembly protein|tara:strand:- start:157 stop:495 length:339 start_codon:yes stop_codon:yes gene_type:complete
MLELTENAEKRIKWLYKCRLLLSSKIPRLDWLYIRIGIKDAGCSGFEYTFDYDNEILEKDKVSNNIIVVGEAAQPYLEGSTLDWIKEGVNERFKIINPNESSQCGCGVSVQF